MTQRVARLLAVVFVVATFATNFMWLPAANALVSQIGADQVTLNSGGGMLANGSDGIRFTINATANTDWNGGNYANAGQDAVTYRATNQYCCSAGAPMLSIGGVLYGQAGPASGSAGWSSIQVIASSGAATVGARTSATGNSSATVRYTVIDSGLTYLMDRTVTYTYPNDYVTDSYTFTIPDGNTDTVKFYLGGDTAPGSSDSGYGVMLTEPVRTVISLNTSSQIMFGFREVPGSKPFDGATSQSFHIPYSTVVAGGNIGFVGTPSNHDAGLMMQWNLGSTPGVQTASMQQFATQQGTNLNALLSADTTTVDVPVHLSVSIVNTVLATVNGLGYTVTLPTGLAVATGSQSSTCGGTVTATAGSSTLTLVGGSAASASNCVVSVPVVASLPGSYVISGGSVSGLAGLTNNVGTSTLTVLSGIDLNDDAIDDSMQDNVHSYTSSVTDETVVLEVDSSCTVDSAHSAAESANTVADAGYNYVNGLMNFTVDCGTPGYTTTVKQYYYNVSLGDFVLRKHNPNTNAYFTIDGAALEQVTIGGSTVTVVTYEITDGGTLDIDGSVNGLISDPAGLAVASVGVPNTGLGGARK